MKILIWGDSPTATTGFARVLREIFTKLIKFKNPEIAWLGVNYSGSPHNFPFKIYPAQEQLVKFPDITGIKRLPGFIEEFKPDVLFILQDLWMFNRSTSRLSNLKMIAKDKGRPFKIVYYFPVDGEVHQDWADSLDIADIPITYTQWAKNQCVKKNPKLKDKLQVIPHGVNTKTFYPIQLDKTKCFTFTNIGRNMQRKQLALGLIALSKLKLKDVKNHKMYIHAQPDEFGISLFKIAKSLGLKYGFLDDDGNYDVLFPEFGFTEHKGISDKELNKVYNEADCFFSTTVGEGWGLPLLEAAACKKLLLVPEIEPLIENLKDRAIFYKTNGCVTFESDLSLIRPIPDIDDLTNKMESILRNSKKYDKLKQNAYDWAQSLSWEKVFQNYWLKIFKKIYDLYGL